MRNVAEIGLSIMYSMFQVTFGATNVKPWFLSCQIFEAGRAYKCGAYKQFKLVIRRDIYSPQNFNQADATATQSFYQSFFLEILSHLFAVVTDTSHSGNLTQHATILAHMFTIVEQGKSFYSMD